MTGLSRCFDRRRWSRTCHLNFRTQRRRVKKGSTSRPAWWAVKEGRRMLQCLEGRRQTDQKAGYDIQTLG